MLTENASLLNEHFDSSLEGIAVGFEYDEKRFKENWAAYLTSENITDSTLLETYRVICRVGPPPRYIKTLLGCGEADNCLSLMENFLLHRAAAGMPLYSVIVHNSSNQDLQEWLGGSSLPGLEVHSCSVVNAPIHFLSLGTAERRPVLIVRGVNDADVQLLLSHQTWIFRGGLPNWSGGWFDKNRQEVEKGAPGATYIRYTPAIPGIQMEGWLQAMDKYCMEYQLEGKIPGCVASVLAATPWLSLKRMWKGFEQRLVSCSRGGDCCQKFVCCWKTTVQVTYPAWNMHFYKWLHLLTIFLHIALNSVRINSVSGQFAVVFETSAKGNNRKCIHKLFTVLQIRSNIAATVQIPEVFEKWNGSAVIHRVVQVLYLVTQVQLPFHIHLNLVPSSSQRMWCKTAIQVKHSRRSESLEF